MKRPFYYTSASRFRGSLSTVRIVLFAISNMFFRLLLRPAILPVVWGVCFGLTFGQNETDSTRKIVVSTGKAEIQLSEEMPLALAKEKTRSLAMIDAIERAFGVYVARSNASTIDSETQGHSASTKTGFKMIANSFVKGDWLRETALNYEEIERQTTVNGKKRTEKWLVCTISGECAEIIEADYDVIVGTFSCPKVDCEKSDFKQGESLYLYFRSPISGYLSVWLDDRTTVDCLIPYLNQGDASAMRIEADKPYILFSQDSAHNYFDNPRFMEDELVLTADTPTGASLNRLFIVFSPEPFMKPILSGARLIKPEESKRFANHLFARHLSVENFQTWMARNQTANERMKVVMKDITVTK